MQEFSAAINDHYRPPPAKLALILRQRARIYQHQDNFSSSLQDYAQAIRLDPKSAVLWSERGYVSLRDHEFKNAVNDEAQAISLDSRLAWAFFLRGTAFGDLGNSGDAASDIKTAVMGDGVYESTDGGETWTQSLSVNQNTGCSEPSMDAKDPNTIFAGMWQVDVKTWNVGN